MGQENNKQEPILLGDTIETIFKKMGVDYVVKTIVKNCNCQKRKQNLNRVDLRKIIPYKPSKKNEN